MAVRYKILVIGRQGAGTLWLQHCLVQWGYDCISAEASAGALSLMKSHLPDMVVIFDDGGATELTDTLRSCSSAPILVLGSGAAADAASVFKAGADDYIRPDCGETELEARIERALRRAQCDGLSVSVAYDGLYTIGEVTVDFVNRQVLKKGKSIGLTPQEYRIVAILAKNAGKLVPYKDLLRGVWGEHVTEGNRILRVNMANIRRKLENDPARPEYILTQTGAGYRFLGSDQT